MSKEIVICSAIKLKNGLIIRGHRHFDCMETARRMPSTSVEQVKHSEQGFMTSRNRFVGREEAYTIQTNAGIPSADSGGYRGDWLYSEDLY